MHDKTVKMALLLDFYGQLLTGKQMDIVDMYYNYDLSLGEISEHHGISRQGVYDTLKRAEKTLCEYEEKLELVSRFFKQKESMKKIIAMLDEILEQNDFNEDYTKEKLMEIKKYISE